MGQLNIFKKQFEFLYKPNFFFFLLIIIRCWIACFKILECWSIQNSVVCGNSCSLLNIGTYICMCIRDSGCSENKWNALRAHHEQNELSGGDCAVAVEMAAVHASIMQACSAPLSPQWGQRWWMHHDKIYSNFVSWTTGGISATFFASCTSELGATISMAALVAAPPFGFDDLDFEAEEAEGAFFCCCCFMNFR